MTKLKIKAMFDSLEQNNDKAFIAYIMAGDGGLGKLPEQIKTLEEAGVDLIEIGIPFSDPAADGPVIQGAGLRALAHDTSLKDILNKLEEIKDDVKVPYVLMTYYNPVFHYGLEQFSKDCTKANVSGIIVPDVPLEEEAELKAALSSSEVAIIRLATLTTPDDRLKKITEDAEGFIYAVTVNSVTGEHDGYKQEVYDNLERIKSMSSIPVCAGFGIQSAESAAALGEYTDGVIVGSKIVTLLNEGRGSRIQNLIPKRQAEHAK